MTNKYVKEYEMKLDANDQAELEKLQDRIRAAQETAPGEMASEIAGDFYQPASLFHADLRRQIIDAIETFVESAVAQCLKEFKDI